MKLRAAPPLGIFGRGAPIHRVAISPGGDLVAALSDNDLALYSLDDYRPRGTLAHQTPLWDVGFSPDGSTVACATDGGEILFAEVASPTTWRGDKTIRIEGGSIASLAFSPVEGRRELAAGISDGRILIIGPSGEVRVSCEPAHRGPAVDLVYSADGATLYSASWDRSVALWETSTGHLVQRIELPHLEPVSCVDLVPGEQSVVFADWGGRAFVYDPSLRTLTRRVEAHLGGDYRTQLPWLGEKEASSVQCVLASDGRLLITSGCDHGVRFWSMENGRQLGDLPGQDSAARGLALTPDGKRLITTGHGYSLRVWDLAALLPEDW